MILEAFQAKTGYGPEHLPFTLTTRCPSKLACSPMVPQDLPRATRMDAGSSGASVLPNREECQAGRSTAEIEAVLTRRRTTAFQASTVDLRLIPHMWICGSEIDRHSSHQYLFRLVLAAMGTHRSIRRVMSMFHQTKILYIYSSVGERPGL